MTIIYLIGVTVPDSIVIIMIMVIKYDHCLDDGDADYYLVSFSTDYEGHVDHRVCQELHVVILARESIPLLATKHNFEVRHCFSVSRN